MSANGCKRWSKKQFKPQRPRAQHKGDGWVKLETRVKSSNGGGLGVLGTSEAYG